MERNGEPRYRKKTERTDATREENKLGEPSGAVRKEPVVCTIGLARSVESAYQSSQQWPGFHAFWVVDSAIDPNELQAIYDELGMDPPSSDIANVLNGNVATFQVLQPESRALQQHTWQSAVDHAMKHVRATGYPCEYYFLLHDDIKWFLNPSFKPASPSKITNTGTRVHGNLADELHSVLSTYRPAVVGFSWQYSDITFSGAKECASTWAHLRAAPLTSLESSVGVYHASIAEFLLPFPPTGSDGSPFLNEKDVSLSTVWVNMFVPFMFRSHAVRVNSIRYTLRNPRTGQPRAIPLPIETLDNP